MTKKESGRLGGLCTLAKYGKDHMRRIGSNGGKVTRAKYRLVPVGISAWVMVDRITGTIKAKIGC